MAKDIQVLKIVGGPSFKEEQIDLDNRVIKNVILCQTGEIKDYRPYSLEQEFIDDLVAFANKLPEGVQCNFGHNYDNLGKGLGRIKNVRKDGNKAMGDLHIYESADESPTHPGMGTYVMKLGGEDNKAIMLSIGFVIDHFYQYDKAGSKIKVRYWDAKGNWIPAISEYGKMYVKMKELKKCDVVDEGAATDTFYSAEFMPEAFNDIISHEAFPEFLEDHYQQMPVLSEFFIKKSKKGIVQQIRELMAGPETDQSELEAKANKADSLKSELAIAKTSIAALEAEKSAFETQKIALEAKVSELEAKVAELERQPADKHTSGDEDTTPDELKNKSWMKDPINLKGRKSN